MQIEDIKKRVKYSDIVQYIDSNLEYIERQIYCVDWPDKHEYYLVVGKRKIELGFRWTAHKEWMIIKDSSEYRDLGYRYRGYIIVQIKEIEVEQNQNGEMIGHIYYIEE